MFVLFLSACSLLEIPNDSRPSLTVLEPEDGAVIALGDELRVVSEIEDGSDPLFQVAMEVESDLDGPLCLVVPGITGLAECSVVLSEGTHQLSVRAEDLGSKVSDVTLSIVVEGEPVDSGGDDTGTDTGGGDTGTDTGGGDTGAVDTGSEDTGGTDTGTEDTGAEDTGTQDTAGGDTGVDTGDPGPVAAPDADSAAQPTSSGWLRQRLGRWIRALKA